MKKIFILTSSILLLSIITHAQEIGQILSGSIADANKYLNNYLEPFGKGEILNMGRGWFNTARVHKKLGFDISVSAQLAIVPDDKQSFVFNKTDYSTFKLTNNASSAIVPTFLGSNPSTTEAVSISVSTQVNGKNVNYDFKAPGGIGDDLKKNLSLIAVPLPVAQVGIGLIKHTDLKLRYFPKTNFSGTEIGVFGLAVQHEFSNYLPFFKKIPFLHFSGLVGYNSVNTSFDLTGKGVSGSNQKAELSISALTVQGIASVKLAMFEFYTSIGYVTGKADAALKGSYTFTYKDDVNPIITYSNTVNDPVALSYTTNSITNSWGLRVHILFLKVFADYTFANYNGASAGVAFSFR